MTRHLGLLFLTIGIVNGLAPKAAAQDRAAEDARPAPHVDLKILFWYDRNHPLESFKQQVYDVRKGEYTPRVDAWLAMVKKQHPHYVAYVREIDLARFRGTNDSLKAGDAIIAEFLAVAFENGVDLTGPPRIYAGARPTERAKPLIRGSSAPAFLAPGAGSSPFPIPYPRPHP
jgi:hypothetical protein